MKTVTINRVVYRKITYMEALDAILGGVNGKQDVYSIVDGDIVIPIPTYKYWTKAHEEKNFHFAVKAKVFNTMQNIGKAKYVINTFNGKDKHRDGSDFYGVETFGSKVMFNDKVKELINNGWIEV